MFGTKFSMQIYTEITSNKVPVKEALSILITEPSTEMGKGF